MEIYLSHKSELRRIAKLKRKSLWYPTSFLPNWQKFLQQLNFNPDPLIAAYFPMPYEADCQDIIEWLYNNSYKVLLPVVSKSKDHLLFNEWKPNSILRKNDYGITEIDNNIFYDPHIIIVPLLAFDKMGNRLGYGEGWYDKTLAYYSTKNSQVVSVGLGYSFQEVEKVPCAKHDIPLQSIITENRLIFCS